MSGRRLSPDWSRPSSERRYSSSWASHATACAAFVGAELVAGHAVAYRTGSDVRALAATQKVRWDDPTIEYEINEMGAPGVSIAETQSAIASAAQSWASIACGGPNFRYRGVTSNHAVPSDGRNTVEWLSDWGARGFQADAAGQTDVQYEQVGGEVWRIVEADIYLNAENHIWSTLLSTDDSSRDVATVLTHELGHVIGLMHPCEPTAQGAVPVCDESFGRPTMHPVYGPDQLSLEADDKAGACFLYPSASCSEGSCGANQICTRDGCKDMCGENTCADGETCVSDVCVPQRACPEGTCPQVCSSAMDCDFGQACMSGVCRSGQRERGDLCAHDQECHSGSCVDGFCAILCDALQSCGNAETCETDHSALVCVSLLGRDGESCEEAHDCLGNQCLAGGEGGPVCTRLCSPDAPCGGDWACSTVHGRAVCTPPTFGSAGGCSFVAPTHARSSCGGLVGLGIAAALVFRRPQRRSLLTRYQGRS